MSESNISDEHQVRQLEHEWIDAFRRGDTKTLDRILADDFIFTDPEGKLLTKAEWMSDMTSGELTFESIHIDDLQVRIYGDAAVANGPAGEMSQDVSESKLAAGVRRYGVASRSLAAVRFSTLSTSSAVSDGFAEITRAAIPATSGVALEVPPNVFVTLVI